MFNLKEMVDGEMRATRTVKSKESWRRLQFFFTVDYFSKQNSLFQNLSQSSVLPYQAAQHHS